MVIGLPKSGHEHRDDARRRDADEAPLQPSLILIKGDFTMGQATQFKHALRTDREATRQKPGVEAGFKPLALPALAAAVHMTRQAERRSTERALPAILREEALIG
jgi:hypothetical protein